MLLNVHFQDMVTCNIRQKQRKGPTQELFTTAVSFGKQNLSTTSALLCPRVLVSGGALISGRMFSCTFLRFQWFGTYFTHAQSCNVTRVQSATEWTASVHTLHMPKAVM